MVNDSKRRARSSHRELVVLALSRDGDALADVRRIIEAQLIDAGLVSLVDEAVLAATELATNALIHTDSDVSVSVATEAGRLDVLSMPCDRAKVNAGGTRHDDRQNIGARSKYDDTRRLPDR